MSGAYARLGELGEGFARTLHTAVPRRVWVISGVVTLAALAVFVGMAPHGVTNGDVALYSQQITAGDPGELAVHLGYFWLGRGATALLPSSPDQALNLMSAVFAALCVGLVSLTGYVLTGRESAAVGAGLAIATLGVFVSNAVGAEVYVVQAAFFLASVLFALLDRPVPAGLTFAVAFLVTPSTVLALPFLALLRPNGRFLARAAVAALVPVAVVLGPHAGAFLSGDRGVLGAAATGTPLVTALGKEWRELRGFYLLGGFALYGIWVVANSRRHRLFTIGLALMWLLQFVFGEKFLDVPVQLPLYGVLAALAGLGLARALHASAGTAAKAALAAVFVAGAVLSGWFAYPPAADSSRAIDAYRDSVLQMGETAAPGSIAIAGWSPGFVAEHYLAADSRTLEWVNTDDLAGHLGIEVRDAARARIESAIASGDEMWLLGPLGQGVYGVVQGAGYSIEPLSDSIAVARPVGR